MVTVYDVYPNLKKIKELTGVTNIYILQLLAEDFEIKQDTMTLEEYCKIVNSKNIKGGVSDE
jgi:hypothetical protein